MESSKTRRILSLRAACLTLLTLLALGVVVRPLGARGVEAPSVLARARRIVPARALIEQRVERGLARQGEALTLRAGSEAAWSRGEGGLSWSPVDDAIEASWSPERPGEMRLRGGGVSVGVQREGAGPAAAHEGFVVQAGSRGASLLLGRSHDLEELVEIPAGPGEVSYRFELPEGFALRGAPGGVVEVRDRRGVARLRMVARASWPEGGEGQTPSVEVDGSTARIAVDGGGLGGLLDPSWSSAGTLVFKRLAHTTIVLPDGRTLLVGGDELGVGELFDPELHTFTVTGALQEPRDHPFLHRRPDGKVLVIGGSKTGTVVPAETIELYEPVAGTFSTLGKFGRSAAMLVPLPDGGVLSLGGADEGGPPLSVMERLDPYTGERTVVGQMLLPRVNASAVVLPGGQVLVVPGDNTQEAELVDTTTWQTSLAGLRQGQTSFASGLVALGSGEVLLSGSPGGLQPELWNPTTKAFRLVSSCPGQVTGRVLLPTGQVLMTGGGEMSTALFDPATSLCRGLPQATQFATLTMLPTGQVLVASGTLQSAVGTAQLVRMDAGVDRISGFQIFGQVSGAMRLPSGEVMLAEDYGQAHVYSADLGRTDLVDDGPTLLGSQMAVMASGRVMFQGIGGFGAASGGSALFDPALRRWLPGPTFPVISGHTITPLPDGRLVLAGGDSMGVQTGVRIWDEKSGALSEKGAAISPRVQHTATLLQGGGVLLVGGQTAQPAEILDLSTLSVQAVGGVLSARVGHTATMLPGGDVLIVGGVLANPLSSLQTPATPLALRYEAKSKSFIEIPWPGVRYSHDATPLADGRVLISGGFEHTSPEAPDIYSALIFDPATNAVLDAGSSTVGYGRNVHSVLLVDGRVLCTKSGGKYFENSVGSAAEVFDPVTLQRSPPQSQPVPILSGASASVLPGGDLLFAGGLQGDVASGSLVRFSPSKMSFELLGAQLEPPRSRQGAVMMPDGSTLLVGGAAQGGAGLARIDRIDPTGTQVSSLGSMGQGRVGPAVVRLATGKALVVGGGEGAVEVVESGGAVSQVTQVTARSGLAAAQLEGGAVVLAGGTTSDGKKSLAIERLDLRSFSASPEGVQLLGESARVVPLRGGGALVAGGSFLGALVAGGGLSFLATVAAPLQMEKLPSGDTLVVNATVPYQQVSDARFYGPTGAPGGGWQPLTGDYVYFQGDMVLRGLPTGELFYSSRLGGPGSVVVRVRETLPRGVPRPRLLGAPGAMAPGEVVTVKGQRLRRLSAVGADYQEPRADLFPSVFFQVEGGGPVFARVLSSSDDEVKFEVPVSSFPGPGWLFASVGGVPSEGVFSRLLPSELGRGCEGDGECGSGFCIEGVCCEKVCGGGCSSCLASRQGAGGKDGLCLPVATGSDPKGECEAESAECGRTGQCDGAGQCQLVANGTPCSGGGTCNFGSCLAPLPAVCAPDGKALVLPDGQRQDCAPYVCRGAACLAVCAQDGDCAAGQWCTAQGDCRTCSEDLGAVVAQGIELPCAPYACSKGVCRAGCGSDQDCSAGYRCAGGVCGPYCDEDGVRLLSPGEIVDCSPYRCLNERCAERCATNVECAPGMLCGLDGQCRAPGPAPAASGSSCAASGRPASGSAWPWLLVLGAVARRRRAARAAVGSLLAALASRGLTARAADPPGGASSSPSASAAPAAPAAPSGSAAASPEEARLAAAKEEFRKGVLLFEAGDVDAALEHFRRSRAIFPSRKNTLNMAVSLEKLGRYDEALELFEDVLTRYASEMSDEEKAQVPAQVAAMRGRVGELEVSSSVNGELYIDGRRRAELPLTTPLRLLPGRRRVRVIKEGHEPFEESVEVRQGERSWLDAKPKPLTSSGRLRVEVESLAGAEVLIDDVRVGALPWEGTLAPGPHVVQAIFNDAGSAPSLATVIQGQTTLLRLRVGPLGPAVRLAVEPASASLRLGDVPLGRGSWEGRLPAGTYAVSAVEEGYVTASRSLSIPQQGGLLSLSLEVDQNHPRWPRRPVARPWVSLGLGGALGVSLHSGSEESCGAGCGQGAVLGSLGLLTVGFDLPRGPSLELQGGYLSASTTVERRLRRQIDGGSPLVVDYNLTHDPYVRGILLAAGVSQPLALGGGWALRGGLAAGVMLVTGGDDVRGSASGGGASALLRIDGGDTTGSSTPLVVIPRLGVERSVGSLVFSGALQWLFITSSGPVLERGTVIVPPSCSPSSPSAVGCAPEEDLVRGQRTHGLFSLFLPTFSLRYTFGSRSP